MVAKFGMCTVYEIRAAKAPEPFPLSSSSIKSFSTYCLAEANMFTPWHGEKQIATSTLR